MLPQFEDNAAYIWAIVIIGLTVPALLGLYAGLKARFAKRRLERLQASEKR
ncbi:MAG: hypothetical protein RIB03_04995 [Henriciella sp.]|uniref:hypothetical protein n=1 Tax=Henriciella sp. TaxID=1968823 RepID=UPI0032ECA16B